eukprot:gene3103-3398_t
MSRLIVTLFFAFMAVAMAFQPVRLGRVASRAMQPVALSPVEVATEMSNVFTTTQLIAKDSDFGGYAGPAGSLLLIAFIILALAPPVVEKK